MQWTFHYFLADNCGYGFLMKITTETIRAILHYNLWVKEVPFSKKETRTLKGEIKKKEKKL